MYPQYFRVPKVLNYDPKMKFILKTLKELLAHPKIGSN